jgi:hypothetical protein
VAVSDDIATLPAPVVTVVETMPGRNGGLLRRGNPGNKGASKSALARSILEAATPRAARQLAHIALQGTLPEKDGKQVAIQDRIKALDLLLARGGVPIRTELTGADGTPFTIAVRAAHDGD